MMREGESLLGGQRARLDHYALRLQGTDDAIMVRSTPAETFPASRDFSYTSHQFMCDKASRMDNIVPRIMHMYIQ